LHRGDIRACSDESAVVERERLRALYLEMLGRLADIARRDSDYSAAHDYTSLVLKYDTWREGAPHAHVLLRAARPAGSGVAGVSAMPSVFFDTRSMRA